MWCRNELMWNFLALASPHSVDEASIATINSIVENLALTLINERHACDRGHDFALRVL